MAVWGVVPFAAIVPAFSFIVHITALQREHHYVVNIHLLVL